MFRKGKSWTRLIVYLAVALVVAAGAWWGIATILSPRVTVTRVTEGPVVEAFYATGTVRPEREYPIKTPVEGTLEKVLVDKGDRVKAGQTLAIIKDPQLQFRADRARAMLNEKIALAEENTSPALNEIDARIQAMTELMAISKREVDRLNSMSANNAASNVDLDRAIDQYKTRWSQLEALAAQRRAKVLELKREVDVAQAELDAADWDVKQQTLVAPIDGVVLDRPTSQGTRVAVNDTVMRVADVGYNQLVMRAAVDEEDVTRCRDGQVVKMSLYAFPNVPITGKVTRIYNEADKDRRTFEVDVKFDTPDPKLSAGMTGELAFIIAEKSTATILPATALQNGSIYAVRDGRIARTGAKVGLSSFERVEVIEGIDKNDTILISPIGNMSVGQHVRTTDMDPDEAAGLLKQKQIEATGGAFKGFN